ncbi:hypothetical protein DFH09DRAFT_1074769 [Mycena vulgaris]|nr:hypothetical protein DFH09DRAFT_1074769 [Mycena vulgaris]
MYGTPSYYGNPGPPHPAEQSGAGSDGRQASESICIEMIYYTERAIGKSTSNKGTEHRVHAPKTRISGGEVEKEGTDQVLAKLAGTVPSHPNRESPYSFRSYYPPSPARENWLLVQGEHRAVLASCTRCFVGPAEVDSEKERRVNCGFEDVLAAFEERRRHLEALEARALRTLPKRELGELDGARGIACTDLPGLARTNAGNGERKKRKDGIKINHRTIRRVENVGEAFYGKLPSHFTETRDEKVELRKRNTATI